jgi:GNAT superfamily N-acetyltransferase
VSELEAVEAAAYSAMAEAAGGVAVRVRGGVCLRAPVSGFEVNRVVAVDEELDLDAVAAVYDAPHLVCVPPWVTSLDARLEQRGYTRTRAWVKFARDTRPLEARETPLRVEETPDALVFAAAVAEGFGIPPEAAGVFAFVNRPGFAGFVAWDGDEPVAGGALYSDGDHAWLGTAATRPAFRGRGAQTALLAARIDRARGLGASTISVETGAHDGEPAPSYRNILRAGFVEEYTRPNWLLGARVGR